MGLGGDVWIPEAGVVLEHVVAVELVAGGMLAHVVFILRSVDSKRDAQYIQCEPSSVRLRIGRERHFEHCL